MCPLQGCPKPIPMSRAGSWVLFPQFSSSGLRLAKLWAWTIFHFLKKAMGRILFWCHLMASQTCTGSCECCWHQKWDWESRWKIHSLPNLNVSNTAEVSDASSDLKSVNEAWVWRKCSQSSGKLQLLLGCFGNHRDLGIQGLVEHCR